MIADQRIGLIYIGCASGLKDLGFITLVCSSFAADTEKISQFFHEKFMEYKKTEAYQELYAKYFEPRALDN